MWVPFERISGTVEGKSPIGGGDCELYMGVGFWAMVDWEHFSMAGA